MKMAELALIRSVPDSIAPKIPQGRLRGKCEKLIKLVDQEVKPLLSLSDKEFDLVDKKIAEFGKRTGWEGKEKHVVTVLSFLLAMIEESKFSYPQAMTDLLNDIFDYFERDKKAKAPCFVGGAVALKKWKGIK